MRITHSEYKFEDGDYYLIEMAARGGGSRIASDIVPFMSGVDNYQLLINAALGPDSICGRSAYIRRRGK